jgi:adenosylcobinamide amidohydrolase
MYSFYKRQQVYKLINGKIEKNYRNGSPKVYTVEFVDKNGIKLYDVPYVYFNNSGYVENIDVRKCPVIVVNERTKTGNRNLWHTWNNACIKPLEEYIYGCA